MDIGRGFESDKQQPNSKRSNMKRPLQGEEAAAEMETQPKRTVTCNEGENSDMEQFFALLDRIEATEKLHRTRKGPKRTVTCEPVWRPAFVLEDFCPKTDLESKPQEEEESKEETLKEHKNDDESKNTYDFLNQSRSPSSSEPNTSNNNNNEDCGIQGLDLNMPSGTQLFL